MNCMTERVFFTIIIATLNVLDELSACINSINSQEFTNYEVIISDGGSVDGTAEYIASRSISNLAWYKSFKDCGIYDALNIAMDHISGKWILVIGADDRLTDPRSLSRAYDEINNLKQDVGIAYGDLIISRNGKTISKTYPNFIEFERKYSGGAFIHHQTAFIRSSSLVYLTKFSDRYKIHADYDFILKITKSSGAHKIKGAFVIFSSNGVSSKFANLWKSFSEIRSIRKNHGFKPMPFPIYMTYIAIFIRKIPYLSWI